MEQETPRKLLSDDDVPFAPTVTVAAPAAPEARVAVVERILGFTHRWRIPLALVFVALIGVAGRSAYESQQPTDPVLTVPDEAAGASQAGALSVAVGEIAASDQDPEEPPGQTTVAPAGPSAADSDLDRPRSTTTPPTTSRVTRTTRATTRATVASSVTTSPTTTSASSTTSTSTTTTPATSSVPSTTAPTTTTTRPTTTTSPPPTGPGTISGKVTFETSSGRPVNGLSLTLYNDVDGDGDGDTIRLRDSTNASGTFSWNVDSGCYLVDYIVPDGQRVLIGSSEVAVCVSPGQNLSGRNVVISLPRIDPPSYCEVQIGSGSAAGVEIHDPSSDWADSYVFYDSAGRFVLSTTSLGPPDDREPSEPSIEWTSNGNGFEESAVYSVAAVHSQGAPSSRVTCRRINL